MCEYCEKGKPIKKNDGGSYYKIIESEIEHHDECLDSYYSYTEKIPINYCPMCRKEIEYKIIASNSGSGYGCRYASK